MGHQTLGDLLLHLLLEGDCKDPWAPQVETSLPLAVGVVLQFKLGKL